MAACTSFQSQMLDYLYDLLDADEGRALEEHLKVCAPCQAALKEAQGHRRLLGVAAKSDFPAVRFTVPSADAPAPEDRPQAVPFRRPRWAGWAVAAALLLAVGGLGVPGGMWGWKLHELRQQADVAKADYEGAHKRAMRFDQEVRDRREDLTRVAREVQQDQAKAAADYQIRLDKLDRAVAEQRLRVSLSGPPTLQPGAPNIYQVLVQEYNNQPANARLTASVRDKNRKEVFKEENVEVRGTHTLRLPTGVELRGEGPLALEISARRPNGPPSELRAELPLAAPLFITHLTTDKPMYQPGETVRFRSLTLERFSLKPPQEDFRLVYTITNPLGSEVHRQDGVTLFTDPQQPDALLTLGPDRDPVRGVGAGEFVIEPAFAGGEYVLTVQEAAGRFPEEKRKFLVNQYQKPRLNKELDYNRKSYGPGDEVLAACKVKRAEGGAAVANQSVTVTVNVDGKTYAADGKESGNPIQLRTDAQGAVNVRFKLPPAMERGLATLSVVFTDGGSTETLAKPIPIVLKKLNVEFFPEGGDLVAGVPNRVYFQVRTTLDKPAELAGRVVDEAGNVVAEGVQTLNDDQEPGVNQGTGAFTFTPRAGKKYQLKIDTPRGIEGRHELPEVKPEGVVLHARRSVIKPGESLGLTVYPTTTARELLVGAYCRGRLIDHRPVTATSGKSLDVDFPLKDAPGGVYRVTVFEQTKAANGAITLRPLAERLVYRMPAEQLNLAVKPTKERYVPGDAVTLSVRTTDEKQAPTPAVLMVAVVDKSVLTMADEKTARSMPTHFFLTTEVRKPEDMEYADFLLGSHPKALTALDLLLGTQGWRRFAEQDPAKFKQEQRAEADRLLVTSGLEPKPSGDLGERERLQAHVEYAEGIRKSTERQEKAQQAWAALVQDEQQRPQLLQARDQANANYAAAVGAADTHRKAIDRFRTVALWVLLPLLLLGAGVGLLLAILRDLPRAVPYYAVSAACMVLILVGIVALQWGDLTGAKVGGPNVALARDIAPLPEAAATQPNFPGPTGDATAARPEEKTAAPADRLGNEDGARPGAAGFPGRGGLVPPQPAAPGQPRGNVRAFGVPDIMLRRQLDPDQGRAKDARLDEALRILKEEKKMDRAVGGFGLVPALQQQQAGARGLAGGPVPAGERENRARLAIDGRGAGRGMGGRAEAAQLRDLQAEKEIAMPPPLVVREYAHRRQSSATPDVRRDFTETLYWHPVLVVPDGKGEVSFDLCDSVTTFQVAAVGHTLDGRLGSVLTTLEARKPFTLEPKLPLEVTADDKIDIPVSVANNTDKPHTAMVRVKGEGLNLLKGQALEELPLGADQRKRLVYRFQPGRVEGPAQLYLEGEIKGFEGDKVLHTFQVVPQGFPVLGSKSDMLEKTAQDVIELPRDWLQGTLKARVEVYPSTLADLQKGLAALLREPNGCFEQTSTSNYPNLLILDYLKETDQALPEVERRARELLARGAQKLTSYECPYDGKGRHGFEWFGQQNNAHEALTAYGLMQFRDMARVQEVDPALIERAKQWLLSRRDGKGGFQRNPRALDTFGRAPEDITNAYIIWALTESGKEDDVAKELDRLAEQAKTSKDPYFLSLVANSLLNRNRAEDGVTLLKKVAEAQKPDGHLDAAATSITGSGGRDLQIETTALAVLGWLKANRPADFTKPVQAAVKWVGQQRGGRGGFGSTQATILALKALIAFAKANKKTPEAGELTLFVGEQKIAELKFPAGASEVLALDVPEAEKHLKAGKNAVRVEITGKNVFPYTLSWSYQTLQPLSADQCPVKLETRLDKTTANEGDTVRLTAKVANVSGKGQGMAVAIIGLPAGLTVPEDMKQLKDHARVPTDGTRPLVSAFEVRGRELVLYWRDLAPDQKIEVPLDLVCRVPGEYSGPASRAYLYYNADAKHWVEPLKVAIGAKAE